MTKHERPEDVCLEPDHLPAFSTAPMATPLYLTSVWKCSDPQSVDALLGGTGAGYVYQRDGHPNGDLFASKCARLHHAAQGISTGSGMAAMAAAVLSQLRNGDHLIAGKRLYGRSMQLLSGDLTRFGIETTVVDTCDLEAVAAAVTSRTRMLVVETISNPMLRVADIPALAELAASRGICLLVDNTFATPLVCQPLNHGAALVMESVSKMINGHSDCMLGFLGGRDDVWEDVAATAITWGLASSPFDCWLASRGLMSLPLRVEQACRNASRAAAFLQDADQVAEVHYPGLATHPDHALARRLFLTAADGTTRWGSIVTFTLREGRSAESFIHAAGRIPFCPSLGEISTTVSHPASTSHRKLSPAERQTLGISDRTLRLSIGCESVDTVLEAITEGLATPT